MTVKRQKVNLLKIVHEKKTIDEAQDFTFLYLAGNCPPWRSAVPGCNSISLAPVSR
jgi:hypothetical protein